AADRARLVNREVAGHRARAGGVALVVDAGDAGRTRAATGQGVVRRGSRLTVDSRDDGRLTWSQRADVSAGQSRCRAIRAAHAVEGFVTAVRDRRGESDVELRRCR